MDCKEEGGGKSHVKQAGVLVDADIIHKYGAVWHELHPFCVIKRPLYHRLGSSGYWSRSWGGYEVVQFWACSPAIPESPSTHILDT